MKKRPLEKIGVIFGFTFKQGTREKAFKFMTIGIPIIIFILFAAISIIPGVIADSDGAAVTKKIYLVDETEMGYVTDFFSSQIDKEKYTELSISGIRGKTLDEVCAGLSEDETESIVIDVKELKDEENVNYYKVTTVIPDWTTISKDECEELSGLAAAAVGSVKIITSDIDIENLVYLSSGVYSDVVKAGEKPDTLPEFLIKSVIPMVAVLVIYMMIIIYGQSIGKVVVAEKNSKLLEMLLTSVQPDALIAGKIFAQAAIAIMEFLLWVVSGAAGFIAGDYITKILNPDYDNAAMEAFKIVISENTIAFSPAAIIISVLAVIFGFLFYCILSGLVASCIGKAEDLANGMGIYNIAVIAGFFGSYFPIMMENARLSRIVRIFPVTAAFILGPDALVGNAAIPDALVSLILLIVTDMVLIYITARVYKAKVFYAGTTPVKNVLFHK